MDKLNFQFSQLEFHVLTFLKRQESQKIVDFPRFVTLVPVPDQNA